MASAAKKTKGKKAAAASKTATPAPGLVNAFTGLAQPATPVKRLTRAELKRRQMRQRHWPDSPELHFNRVRDVGYTTVPRTLSLIATLIRRLAKNGDGAAKVYMDLWCRSYDEGFVVVDDEAEFAMSAGYPPGSRHVRTWQDRMRDLEELGFIIAKSHAGRRFGQVLLVHPHFVVEKLRRDEPARVPDEWWQLYVQRCTEIGVKPRKLDELEKQLRSAKGEQVPESEETGGEAA